jgi:hypothetical protein
MRLRNSSVYTAVMYVCEKVVLQKIGVGLWNCGIYRTVIYIYVRSLIVSVSVVFSLLASHHDGRQN